MSRRPTRAGQRPLFLRAMPTYSSNARKSPRRKEAISPTPAPVWLPNLTTRCPLCFDRPPGETSQFPRGKLANMSEVTQILSAIERGDARAAEQLLPLVNDELRRLAAHKLAQEKPGQTLEATALVHEAWLSRQLSAWSIAAAFFAHGRADAPGKGTRSGAVPRARAGLLQIAGGVIAPPGGCLLPGPPVRAAAPGQRLG